MRRRLPAACLAAALAFLPAAGRAYVRSTASAVNPTPIAWDLANDGTVLTNVSDEQVMFRLHPLGSADVTDGSNLEAVERAFRSWTGVSGSSLTFVRGTDSSNDTTLMDQELPVFWTESSTIIDQGTPSSSDDVSVAGALAVTFTYRYTGGDEVGEIIDSNIVFNGVDYAWTTDPVAFPDRFDIESVAIHEIGHALGLDHSPVASATMFPRTASAQIGGRSLSPDDVAAVRTAYPGGNTAANRGAVQGVLTAGSPLFGGLVWAVNGDGVVMGQTLSRTDGSFRIDALPPGDYDLFARPVSDAGSFYLFAETNLGPFYSGLNRSFHSTRGTPVTVAAGAVATRDLVALAGNPAMDILLIGRSGWFTNRGTFLHRGESGVTIAVAGPGLSSGTAILGVSGPGVTITQTLYGSVAGHPSVTIRVDVADDAPLGPRDLIVDNGGERTAAIGGVEVRFPTATGDPGETGSPVNLVAPLSVAQVGSGLDLDWGAAPGADGYRLYRGSLTSLSTGAYDHAVVEDGCFISVTDASLFADIGDGEWSYYLVTGVNLDGEGSAGVDSHAWPRPLPPPACP